MRRSDKGLWGAGLRTWVVFICLFNISCGSGTITIENKELARKGFTPAVESCSSPPSRSVYMCLNESGSSHDLIAVDIFISSSTPVFGAAFDIVYDPSQIEVARREDNSVDFIAAMDERWNRIFAVTPDGQKGTVVIGATLGRALLERGTKPLTGNLPLLTLRFKIPVGKTTLQFVNSSLTDSSGQPIGIYQDSWYAGELSP